MTIDLATAYVVNLFVLASFLVADIIILVRSPARRYFSYWVLALGLWVANLVGFVFARNYPSLIWVASILAISSHVLVLASAVDMVGTGRRRGVGPIALMITGLLAFVWALVTGQSFWVRSIATSAVAVVAYGWGSLMILRRALIHHDRQFGTIRVGSLIGISGLLCTLVWLTRLLILLVGGEPQSSGLYVPSLVNNLSAVLLLPTTVLLNSAYLLREIRAQVEQRRETENRVLVDQNEYLRNRLDAELSANVLNELVLAEESFARCLMPSEGIDETEYDLLRSRIDSSATDVKLRNEMLREEVDYEERVDTPIFFERVRKLLSKSSLPPFQFEMPDVPIRLVLSKSYVFWVCYVVGTMATSGPVRVILTAGTDRKVFVFRFLLDRRPGDTQVPALSTEKIDEISIESQDPALERLFVLASFVRSHFDGWIETRTGVGPASQLAIDVAFTPVRPQE